MAAGLKRGIAGTIRPDLGPLGIDLTAVGNSILATGAGGAKASTMFGFDSIGGGGPFGAFVGGAGVVAVLGNLTVATGFMGDSSLEPGSCVWLAAGVEGADCCGCGPCWF